MDVSAYVLAKKYTNDKTNISNIIDVDIDEVVAYHSAASLAIPTYVADNEEVVHPSILFFPEKWNGYKYWMAMTPYPNQDSAYENPSIVVSQDGETWTDPEGLTNPLVPAPDVGYNADPYLFMSNDKKTMNLVWKYASVQKYIMLKSTTDGINWTDAVAILTTATEEVCPVIIWDNSQYVMWTVNHDAAPYVLNKRTCATLTGTWSVASACTLVNTPAGRYIWHYDIKKWGSQYHMAVSFGLGGSGSGLLYFGKSNDGDIWTFSGSPLMAQATGSAWDTGAFYKPAIWPMQKGNGLIGYKLWYGMANPSYVGYSEITFDKTKTIEDLNNHIIQAKNTLYPWVLCDTFTRADSTTELGVADSGQTWTALTGVLGISNNQAYQPTGANSRSVIDLGVANYFFSLRVPTLGTAGFLNFRVSDNINLWRFGYSGNGMMVQKIVAGSVTTITGLFGKPAANDTLGVECIGDTIKIFVNGKLITTINDSFNNTATKVGINIDNATTRFDNVIARAII